MYDKPQHQIRQQLVLVTAPDPVLVCGLDLLKRHCKLPLEEEFTDDDDTLTIYEQAAERMVESHAEIMLKEQGWRLDLQELPKLENGTWRSIVRLEKTPVTEVEKIEYIDCQGETQTLSEDYYRVYLACTPPTVWIDPAGFTSLDTKRLDAIQISFTGGVEVDSEAEDPAAVVPCNPLAKQAILTIVALMYQKREPVHLWSGKEIMQVPLTYQAYIDTLRWRF